jgi:glycosyltransferase involved in cell wall biosynthesis
VTVEAMASGLTPVCAASGGASDLILHGVNGMLCKPNDAESFAAAIDKLVENPKLREEMSKKAPLAARRFSWDSTLKRYQELYESLANSPAVPEAEIALLTGTRARR